ncbi:MAG: winged helix-turn-helix transcriptional regulator [Gemmatimonadetes bacterium]|nr:winged helix-turn-helix transcriptional regulator [Gemmatimonadota bacterium]
MPILRRDEITDALRQRILSRLHLGLLTHGDRLPSVRDLAEEFSANARVILAAYAALEEEGIVEVRDRSGIYVPPPASLGPGAPAQQTDWLIECLVEGLEHDIPGPELAAYVQRAMGSVRLRAVVVDGTQDQLWSIVDELSRDYGLEARGVDVDELRPGAADAKELSGTDLVVTTAFHAREAQQVGARLGAPVYRVTMCTDLFAEVARLLEREPVYFVVADPRFAARLRRIFESSPGAARLEVRVHGRDDLDSIPPRAPLYLTRLARKRLAGSPLLERGLPEARVFTPDCARELMTFVVRANLAALAAK